MSSVVWLSVFFFFKQKTAYEMRISDWSSDVCSSDLWPRAGPFRVKVADKRGRERIASVHTEAADDGDGRFLATPEAAQARAVGAGLCGGRVRTLAGRGYRRPTVRVAGGPAAPHPPGAGPGVLRDVGAGLVPSR